MELIP